MKTDRFHSLRFRFLIGSVLLLLVLFSLVSLNTQQVLNKFAQENTRSVIAQTSETLNLAIVPYTTTEALDTLGDYLNGLVTGKEFGIFEITYHTQQGLRDAEFSLQPVTDVHGSISWLVPQAIDITERKKAEQQLAHANAEWTQAMDQFDDPIYVLDMQLGGRALARGSMEAAQGRFHLSGVGNHQRSPMRTAG